MATRQDWARLIRANDRTNLAKMMNTLFADPIETFAFIEGANDVAREPSALNRARAVRLITAIEPIFRELSIERANDVLLACNGALKIHTVLDTLLNTRKGEGALAARIVTRLLDLFDMNFGKSDHQDKSGYLITIFIHLWSDSWHGRQGTGWSHTWTNYLRHMHDTGDVQIFSRVLDGLLIGILARSVVVVPLSTWDSSQDPLIDQVLHIPAPDDLVDWVTELVDTQWEEIQTANRSVRRLIAQFRDAAEAYSRAYQEMWLDMMIEPRWALRADGLDRITIRNETLRGCGYRYLTLYPLADFPNVRVCFERQIAGGSFQTTVITLMPSGLTDIAFCADAAERMGTEAVWMDRVIAFVAVKAVWTIVMGHLADVGASQGDDGEGGDGNGGSGDAYIRARFRHLPDGYQASPEARARSLATFRVYPLPGFTFVKSHTRGEPVEPSAAPLFAIDRIEP